ncbi:MAG: hypothetical protein MJE77_08910 [Proteobacteria bacterium]|nr:hypothetical protein [Pseudomonadota bacterium]
MPTIGTWSQWVRRNRAVVPVMATIMALTILTGPVPAAAATDPGAAKESLETSELPNHYIVLIDDSGSMRDLMWPKRRRFEGLGDLAVVALENTATALGNEGVDYQPGFDLVSVVFFSLKQCKPSYRPDTMFKTSNDLLELQGPGQVAAAIDKFVQQGRQNESGLFQGNHSPIGMAPLAVLPYISAEFSAQQERDIIDIDRQFLVVLSDGKFNPIGPAFEFSHFRKAAAHIGKTKCGGDWALPSDEETIRANMAWTRRNFNLFGNENDCLMDKRPTSAALSCGPAMVSISAKKAKKMVLALYFELQPNTTPLKALFDTNSSAVDLERAVIAGPQLRLHSPGSGPHKARLLGEERRDGFSIRPVKLEQRIWQLSGDRRLRWNSSRPGDQSWHPSWTDDSASGTEKQEGVWLVAEVAESFVFDKRKFAKTRDFEKLRDLRFEVDYRVQYALTAPDPAPGVPYPFRFARYQEHLARVALQPDEHKTVHTLASVLGISELTDDRLREKGAPLTGQQILTAGQISRQSHNDARLYRILLGIATVAGLAGLLFCPRPPRIGLRTISHQKDVRVYIDFERRAEELRRGDNGRAQSPDPDADDRTGAEPAVVVGAFRVENRAWSGLLGRLLGVSWPLPFHIELAVMEPPDQAHMSTLIYDRQKLGARSLPVYPERAEDSVHSRADYHVFFDPNMVIGSEQSVPAEGEVVETLQFCIRARRKRRWWRQEVVSPVMQVQIHLVPEEPEPIVEVSDPEGQRHSPSQIEHNHEKNVVAAIVWIESDAHFRFSRPIDVELALSGEKEVRTHNGSGLAWQPCPGAFCFSRLLHYMDPTTDDHEQVEPAARASAKDAIKLDGIHYGDRFALYVEASTRAEAGTTGLGNPIANQEEYRLEVLW